MTGAAVQVGLPPLAAMFNMNGTAYAAEPAKTAAIDRKNTTAVRSVRLHE
jgi:hypothetical protein